MEATKTNEKKNFFRFAFFNRNENYPDETLAKAMLKGEPDTFDYGRIQYGNAPNPTAGCLTCFVNVPKNLVELLVEKGVFGLDFPEQTRTVENDNGTTTVFIDMNGLGDLTLDGANLVGNPGASFKTHMFCLALTIKIVGHWIKHLTVEQRTLYGFPTNPHNTPIQKIVQVIRSLRCCLSEIWDQESHFFVPFENHDEFMELYESEL